MKTLLKPLIALAAVVGLALPWQVQAQAAGAKYEKALLPFTAHAITDGRLVTGQNPQSGKAVARQVLLLLAAQQAKAAAELR